MTIKRLTDLVYLHMDLDPEPDAVFYDGLLALVGLCQGDREFASLFEGVLNRRIAQFKEMKK